MMLVIHVRVCMMLVIHVRACKIQVQVQARYSKIHGKIQAQVSR